MERKRWLVAFAGIALLGFTLLLVGFGSTTIQRALGPATAFACPSVGTVFTLSIRLTSGEPNKFTALPSGPSECRIQSAAWGEYPWMWGILPSPRPLEPPVLDLAHQLWPLRVGKHVVWERPSPDGSSQVTDFRVTDYLPRHVGAGWYWAYTIVKTFRANGHEEVQTLWWSPALKWNIRQHTDIITGPSRYLFNWEVTEISAIGQRATDRGGLGQSRVAAR